jgi:lipoic acid synthetase
MTALSLPHWLLEELRKAKLGSPKGGIQETDGILNRLNLHTVCESARCPNRRECFSHHTATFLILGNICTRGCAFCAVEHGKPQEPDADEPGRLSAAVSELDLTHVVITSVTRDDLDDGGAGHFVQVVQTIRTLNPGVKIELLIPDFRGCRRSLEKVLSASPDILAHNVETVPSLYPQIRSGADYERSLGLLRSAKIHSPHITLKSGLMLGLGENEEEIFRVLQDISRTGCDMLTIGQYLAPSSAHAPVKRYVLPDEFDRWKKEALSLGFKSVASGSLVRSSYKAPVFFREIGCFEL